ncbi:MAG: hypothetical protein JO033_04775 [Acidobacteriaceae bacterium]|nr:hypothetical protein [Acidobacteriaceae bacterium]MBV9179865.1 hypothetical protein [Acidobacteriota bacterium]
MALLSFPNPVEFYESAKNANLERDEVNAFVSMFYSAQISFLWRSGASKLAQWIGEGKALQDAATAMYLSLESLEKKGFLNLTVPQDLLAADNLSKFETSYKEK